MKSFEELFAIANSLKEELAIEEQPAILEPLRALEDAVKAAARSFSGSWLGYHSRVYYADLAPSPPGANFSQEWGMKDLSFTSLGSRGDWREFDFEDVKDFIYESAGNPSLDAAQQGATKAKEKFDHKSDMISIFETELEAHSDPFINKLKGDLEQIETATPHEVAERLRPKGQIMTRDMIAMGQGMRIPPHIDVGAQIASIRLAFEACKAAANIATKAASHLERKGRRTIAAARVGTNVFIGHGRSPAWRELKDFVQDRLRLPWDEFNRIPVAGVTNIARLSEMLDSAAIAFLVLTAEDELADTTMQARMNVIHGWPVPRSTRLRQSHRSP